jgi:hypothetical protein
MGKNMINENQVRWEKYMSNDEENRGDDDRHNIDGMQKQETTKIFWMILENS